MLAYKNDERLATVMSRIAKGYSVEEITSMADYFGQQAFIKPTQETDPKLANFGKKLHKKYCEKCHEDWGGYAQDITGRLAGQWLPYLRYSMQDFASEDRKMHPNMKQRFKQLRKDHGDESVEALVQFYASQ
jgi:sulfide dehydrogenase cytochrome subunit